jgi:hypothetical protein
MVFTQVLFRQQALVFYSARQQAADLYSLSKTSQLFSGRVIFDVALIHGGTNINFGISI